MLLCLSTFINIKSFFTLGIENMVSGFMVILTMLYVFSLPLIVMIFLERMKKSLEFPHIKPRINSLYLNVKTEYFASRQAVTMFLLRRLIFTANIVFLEGYSAI